MISTVDNCLPSLRRVLQYWWLVRMKKPGGKGSAMARLGFSRATMSNLQNVSTFFVSLFTCWDIFNCQYANYQIPPPKKKENRWRQGRVFFYFESPWICESLTINPQYNPFMFVLVALAPSLAGLCTNFTCFPLSCLFFLVFPRPLASTTLLTLDVVF